MEVLIVDDDSILLEVARLNLQLTEKYEVSTAVSAGEALRLIAEASKIYDAILLDIMMPEMDGIEACRRMREHRSLDGTAIVMMTALSDRDHIDAAFRAGADDYVTKPVDHSDLTSRLELNIARRQRENSLRPYEVRRADEKDVASLEIDALLAPETLENYILALDRARASLSIATAFVVENAQEHIPQLEIIGRCLLEEVSQTSCLVSHYGRGRFVCISRQGDPRMSRTVLKRLAEKLQAQGLGGVTFRREVLSDHKSGSEMIAGIEAVLRHIDSAKSAFSAENRELPYKFPDIFA